MSSFDVENTGGKNLLSIIDVYRLVFFLLSKRLILAINSSKSSMLLYKCESSACLTG
jgi:hypothetical protein